MTKNDKVRAAVSSLLQPGETLIDCAYGMRPQGCMFFLCFLACLVPAAMVVLLLFGPKSNSIINSVVFFFLWWLLSVPVIALISNPVCVALTDGRFLVAGMKPTYFRFTPFATGVVEDYPPSEWPKAELKRFVRRFILKLQSARSAHKIQLYPWYENIDAADRIVAALNGMSCHPGDASLEQEESVGRWRCVCGGSNPKGETKCAYCGRRQPLSPRSGTPRSQSAAVSEREQARYRANYSHLSTEQLENLLRKPSELVPGVTAIIDEELVSRRRKAIKTLSSVESKAAENSNEVDRSDDAGGRVRRSTALFNQAMAVYRDSQPKHKPLEFPTFDKVKLHKVYEMFCQCVQDEPDNVDALLMKAQCAYDLYDKSLIREALSDVDRALELAPRNAQAQDIKGSILYVLEWSDLDEVEKLERQIANKQKVLELDPNYSNDRGNMKAVLPGGHAASNQSQREDLVGMEKHLKKLRLERQILSEIDAEKPAVEKNAPAFETIQVDSVEEAMRALFEAALRDMVPVSEARIQKEYLDLSDRWASKKLFDGAEDMIRSIVLRNLSQLTRASGFMSFQIEVIKSGDVRAAQVNAFFSKTFVGIRVWRSEDKLFACGNASFE